MNISERAARRPQNAWHHIKVGALLFAGVALQLLALRIELAMHFTSGMFFDPLPTIWHVVVVAFVPAANGWSLYVVTSSRPRAPRWTALANGAAIAITAVYSLLFLPILPIATIGILF